MSTKPGTVHLSNAAALCRRHHVIVHRYGYTATVTPTHVIWHLPGNTTTPTGPTGPLGHT